MRLDTEAESRFLDYWAVLRGEGISDLLFSLNYRPHITLAMYHELDVVKTIEKLEWFIGAETEMPMEFRHLTADAKGIFCQPRENTNLRAFHRRFEEQLGASFRQVDLAEIWMPHCTIGMDLPEAKVGYAVGRILESWKPIEARATRLSLLRFRPGEVLWEKALN